jgi:hypothetical protein
MVDAVDLEATGREILRNPEYFFARTEVAKGREY